MVRRQDKALRVLIRKEYTGSGRHAHEGVYAAPSRGSYLCDGEGLEDDPEDGVVEGGARAVPHHERHVRRVLVHRLKHLRVQLRQPKGKAAERKLDPLEFLPASTRDRSQLLGSCHWRAWLTLTKAGLKCEPKLRHSHTSQGAKTAALQGGRKEVNQHHQRDRRAKSPRSENDG
jgi:hypothetical protein